jgi:hypothetical protein
MPSGDAQRTWFPEMVEELRKYCRTDQSLPEFIELRDEFDSILHQIRAARQIHTPAHPL